MPANRRQSPGEVCVLPRREGRAHSRCAGPKSPWRTGTPAAVPRGAVTWPGGNLHRHEPREAFPALPRPQVPHSSPHRPRAWDKGRLGVLREWQGGGMCAILPVRRGGCPPKDTENSRRDPSPRPRTVGKAVGECWGAGHRPRETDREETSRGGAGGPGSRPLQAPEGSREGLNRSGEGTGLPAVRVGRGSVELGGPADTQDSPGPK